MDGAVFSVTLMEKSGILKKEKKGWDYAKEQTDPHSRYSIPLM